MKTFLLALELIIGLLLIFAVILHSPKTEGMGAFGAPARVFRSSGGLDNTLDRITLGLGIIFMVLAFILGVFF